jgi:hypothetical protein
VIVSLLLLAELERVLHRPKFRRSIQRVQIDALLSALAEEGIAAVDPEAQPGARSRGFTKLGAAADWTHPPLDKTWHMSHAQLMADDFPRLDRAHTVRKGELVETTPEVNREVAVA